MIDSPKRPKIVGNFIRQRRETLGLSQRALGLLFEPPVTTQFISNVERGVTPLPPAHVPTLTRALQVSEGEMMALLEKEYTLKLSGRLGLEQGGAPVIPMSQSLSADLPTTANVSVYPHDHAFMLSLYEAFKIGTPETQQAFRQICQSMLGLRMIPSPSSASVDVMNSQTQSQVQVAAAAMFKTPGDQPQG